MGYPAWFLALRLFLRGSALVSFTTISCRFRLFLKARCYNVASRSGHVAKAMGTITTRKRKDGSSRYTAQIRIMQKGVTVYTVSQTF